ncbi:hypothetical protein [Spirillospora sp. NPDC047279]|uniref:hypothetical protein n=1 Tax=Spirillospora sp. NPDC047279 TaxID=3155478 RepID=UPI003403D604
MSGEPVPDPITEGLAYGGQRLAQWMTLAVAVQQGRARRAARLRAAEEARDVAEARAVRAAHEAELNEARSRWAPAHDKAWLRDADLLRVAQVWGAAVPFADDHRSAASAVRKAEERLRDLHPHAMSHYDRFREEGLGPLAAMREAIPFFDRDPHVRTGGAGPVRPSLLRGTGATWAMNFHGPDRGEWEAAGQQLRAATLIRDVRERYRRQGREVSAGELHTILEITTNLPDDIIAEAIQRAGLALATTQPGAPAAELAKADFPFSVEHALASASHKAPTARPPQKKSPAQSTDRNRRRSR